MTASVEHYLTSPGVCACGEKTNNTWTMAAHMRGRASMVSTDLFPSDADVPTSLLLPNSVSLHFDSFGRHKVFPPSSKYLRDLAKVASELADRMDARDAGSDGAA